MKKYYFPPVGFGFFYQLGVLMAIPTHENYELYGSSGGAIVCMISLLKEKDLNIQTILHISEKIRKKMYTNLFPYLDHFLKEIQIIIDSYENEYIERKLSKIYIEVTEIKNLFQFESKFKQPKTIDELQHLVKASCYIPLFFYHQNPIYYAIGEKKFCDGFFGNYSNIPSDFIKINSYSYATLIPLTSNDFHSMFQKGTMYHFEQNPQKMTIFIFFKILGKIFTDSIIYIRKIGIKIENFCLFTKSIKNGRMYNLLQ